MGSKVHQVRLLRLLLYFVFSPIHIDFFYPASHWFISYFIQLCHSIKQFLKIHMDNIIFRRIKNVLFNMLGSEKRIQRSQHWLLMWSLLKQRRFFCVFSHFSPFIPYPLLDLRGSTSRVRNKEQQCVSDLFIKVRWHLHQVTHSYKTQRKQNVTPCSYPCST